jgi:hypothetical protein
LYVFLFGLVYVAIYRIIVNMDISKGKTSGLGEMPKVGTLNEYLYTVGSLYEEARDTNKLEYDKKTSTFYKDKINNSGNEIYAKLESYLLDYGTTFMDPTNPNPPNRVLDDLNEIQDFIEKTEIFMNRRYQGGKYKDITDKKVKMLYNYLASEAISPMIVDQNTTNTQLIIKNFKESILTGMITKNSMNALSSSKQAYQKITMDIKEILGDTMFQYSTDAIVNRMQNIAAKDTTRQRIMDNKRRLAANSRVALAYIYEQMMADLELLGTMPEHSALYVNADTFSRMPLNGRPLLHDTHN